MQFQQIQQQFEERKRRKKAVGEKKTPFTQLKQKLDDEDSIEDPDEDSDQQIIKRQQYQDQLQIIQSSPIKFNATQKHQINLLENFEKMESYDAIGTGDNELQNQNNERLISLEQSQENNQKSEIIQNLQVIQEQTKTLKQLLKNIIDNSRNGNEIKSQLYEMIQKEQLGGSTNSSSKIQNDPLSKYKDNQSINSFKSAKDIFDHLDLSIDTEFKKFIKSESQNITFKTQKSIIKDDQLSSDLDDSDQIQSQNLESQDNSIINEQISIQKLQQNTGVHKISKDSKPYISFGHDNWNLVLHMIFGVDQSVRNAVNEQDFHLYEIDFQRKQKYDITPQKSLHGSNSQSSSHYEFYDFSPRVFHSLRTLFRITPEEYLKSVGPQNLIGSMLMGNITSLQEQCSSGKSGSFFYYTSDSKYMLKTIHHAEFMRLNQILKLYYEHILKNPQTLITRFFGLHKIKYKDDSANGFQRVYFIIMANVFNTKRVINVRYDLKGSKQGRQTKQNPNDIIDPQIALKDLDFDNDKIFVDLDKDLKEAIMKQIKIDVQFFKLAEVIDYSLLLGISYLKNGEQDGIKLYELYNKNSKQSLHQKVQHVLNGIYGNEIVIDKDRMDLAFFESIDGGILSKDKTKIYYVGIIDTLTYYGAKKQLEYNLKYIFHGTKMSCLPPKQYGDRFINYINNIFKQKSQ